MYSDYVVFKDAAIGASVQSTAVTLVDQLATLPEVTQVTKYTPQKLKGCFNQELMSSLKLYTII